MQLLASHHVSTTERALPMDSVHAHLGGKETSARMVSFFLEVTDLFMDSKVTYTPSLCACVRIIVLQLCVQSPVNMEGYALSLTSVTVLVNGRGISVNKVELINHSNNNDMLSVVCSPCQLCVTLRVKMEEHVLRQISVLAQLAGKAHGVSKVS